ncbi:hypothetical protein [Yinghuangia seranimata]|uniref:hypothetical protein n=1 Tax=Yinghuangia seranimata TaxID=408067 RepID=UPI00248C26CA|nr:hypothetical protein [Yinghuangia seranimata]MDI2127438.1 hypothetical protein [Yinghuangia seranimata]
MQAVALVLGAGVAALLVFIGVVVIFAVVVRRSVRRRIERHAPRLRGLVDDAASRARGYTRMGGAGEAARLRNALRRSLEHTRRVLDAGYTRDAQLSEALRLLDRLERLADGLDTDLRMLEREPDPARVARELPVLRERAERVQHAAGSLRWAAQDRERAFERDELDRLGRDVENEVSALREAAQSAKEALGP